LRANNDHTLKVTASTNGYLNAWIDYNLNGSWADPGEQIAKDAPLVAGSNILALHIPASASNGQSYARFRFSSQSNLSFTGSAENGEVEDYAVILQEAFKITSIEVESNGCVTISWNDIELLYTVEVTTNLVVSAWTPAVGTWPIRTTNWTSSDAITNSPIFFRIHGR
jgi:hypothetical protein